MAIFLDKKILFQEKKIMIIYWKSRVVDRKGDRELHSNIDPLVDPAEQGYSEARSVEFHLGLPSGWQEP